MALETGGSLYWKTGIDNAALRLGAKDAVGIVTDMASAIGRINPFVIIGLMATAAFAGMSREAYAFSSDFEDAMTEVKSISEATKENFEGMSDAIVNMSRRTPESARNLAKALYQTVSAGYDGAAALTLLDEASKSAVAGVTSTEVAVDALTTVLNSYRMEADKATEVADIMFTGVKIGKTTFEELAHEIAIVAPLAAASDIAFEEIISAVATLTSQGTPTAEAMTQIRSAIISMNEALGDGWTKTMTLQDGMQKLYDIAGGSKTRLRELTGRVEAMNGVLAMSGRNYAIAQKHLQEHRDSLGATAEAYEIMVDTASNQAKILTNNVKGMFKGLGDSLVEMAKTTMKAVNAQFDNVDKNVKEAEAKAFRKNLEYILQKENVLAEGTMETMYVGGTTVNERIAALQKLGVNVDLLRERVELLYNQEISEEIRKRIYNKLVEDAIRLREQEAKAAKVQADAYDELGGKTEKLGKDMLEQSGRKSLFGYLSGTKFGLFDGIRGSLDETMSHLNKRSAELVEILGETTEKDVEITYKNINRLSDDALVEYERYLRETAEKIKDNEAKKEAILEEADRARMEQYRRDYEELDYIANAIDALGVVVTTFNEKLGFTAQQAARVIEDMNKINQGRASGNEWMVFGAELAIAGTFMNTMETLFGGVKDLNADLIDEMERYDRRIEMLVESMRLSVGQEKLSSLGNVVREAQAKEAANIEALGKLMAAELTSGKLKSVKELLVEKFGATIIEDLLTGKAILTKDLTVISGKDRYKILVDDLMELVGNIQDAREIIAEYENEYREMLTGTTSKAIADSIADGFMSGIDTAKLFADTFEDLMRNAAIQAFKQRIITDSLESWYAQFSSATEGGLTAKEIELLERSLKLRFGNIAKAYEDIDDIFRQVGLSLTDATKEAERRTGISGAISSITEETAGLLEGQFNAVRMNTESMKLNMASMVDHVESLLVLSARIADNTKVTADNSKYLQSIDKRLATPAASLPGLPGRAIGV